MSTWRRKWKWLRAVDCRSACPSPDSSLSVLSLSGSSSQCQASCPPRASTSFSGNSLHLDQTLRAPTRQINFWTNQKGYDNFQTTVENILVRRIQIFWVQFCITIFWTLIFQNTWKLGLKTLEPEKIGFALSNTLMPRSQVLLRSLGLFLRGALLVNILFDTQKLPVALCSCMNFDQQGLEIFSQAYIFFFVTLMVTLCLGRHSLVYHELLRDVLFSCCLYFKFTSCTFWGCVLNIFPTSCGFFFMFY